MRLSSLLIVGALALGLVSSVRAVECNPNDPKLLPPDLVAQTPGRVRVVQRSGARRVIFTTAVANLGKGPLIVRGQTVQTPSGPVTQATQEVWRSDGSTCDHLAGYFVFHPSHNHWHINDFAAYELRKDDPYTGELVAKSDKVSFCLIDITQLRGYHGPRQVIANCLNQQSTQGISVGYADVYDSYLPDQWIDMDLDPANPVPAGGYYLVNVADPDNLLLETNDDPRASSGVVSVSIPPVIGARPARPPRLPRPPHAPHPPHPGH